MATLLRNLNCSIYTLFLTLFQVLCETNLCEYYVNVAWTAEVAHGPFAGSPLVADANADGRLDVISAAFTGEVTVISGEDGLVLPDTKWPIHLQDTSVHASPLQYDINNDGMVDILITTSDAKFYFFKHDGTQHTDKQLHLGPAYFYNKWHQHVDHANFETINKFLIGSDAFEDSDDFIPVDAHVLATPVIVDLNQDGRPEEMVVPVTYYFSKEDYRNTEDLSGSLHGLRSLAELDNYVSGAIVIVNLTDMTTTHTIPLELTKSTSDLPGYLLASPTIIDLDSNGGSLEIVVGTSAGQLHVLTTDGRHVPGFPLTMDAIQSKVTVADVNLDGRLEIVTVDRSGRVQCVDPQGKLVWAATVSGTSSPGAHLADINQDGTLDVVIATNDGKVWALEGLSGKVVPGFPVGASGAMPAPPLIGRLGKNSRHIGAPLDLVTLSENGELLLISGDTKCRKTFQLEEKSLVEIASHNLIEDVEDRELLISTMDGAIMCLATSPDGDPSVRRPFYEPPQVDANIMSHNVFTYSDGKVGLFCEDFKQELTHISGTWFPVPFEIRDNLTSSTAAPYKVKVYLGQLLLEQAVYTQPGHYQLTVPTPDRPIAGDIAVTMTNKHGQIFTDTFAIGMNLVILNDLQWILTFPFVGMAAVLLILYGYPPVDLLPRTHDRAR